MRLSRDKIQRMIDAGGGSSSGGGGGSDIAGGASQAWVNQNYVSIEFFRKVFKIWAAGETSSDPDVEIMPNDITTTVKNIQAQAGLWTEAFLSALGQGSGGGTGGATTLDQLDDVVIQSPTNGQALIYNATTQMWVNGTIQSGTDMATVWSALAAATNEQINASHLSGVLADYVTTTSLQTILGDYLTLNAADQRYITIAYFDRLFRSYNGSTLVSHNDTTTTIDNIKAMFGFWTDMYLSALGRNSAATGLGLDNLTDVTINTPTDGQVLQYNATSSKWENATIQTVVALSGLTDVLLTTPADGEFLMYDSSEGKWVNMSLKTINSQSLIGTGDISVGGGASGNYLPLTGGTLTNPNYGGQLTIHRSVANGNTVIKYTNASNGLWYLGFTQDTNDPLQCLYYTTADTTYKYWVTTLDWINEGFFAYKNDTANRIVGAANNNGAVGVLAATRAGLYINSSAIASGGKWLISGFPDSPDNPKTYLEYGKVLIGDNMASVTAQGRLHVDGSIYTNDRIIIGTGSTVATTSMIVSNSRGQMSIAAAYNYNLQIGFRGDDYVIFINPYSYNVGIGESSPSYKLHVAGTIYATGAITALSDMREKLVNEKAELPIEWIANAPAFSYYWKDKKAHDELLHVGSSAQYWRSVLPEVVLEAKDGKGTLSMQYGVAALVSAITIARKVVDHERRIKQLEQENEELKKQLNAA